LTVMEASGAGIGHPGPRPYGHGVPLFLSLLDFFR